jgi:hypothetical protein
MEFFDDGWDDEQPDDGPEFDSDIDPEGFYLSLLSDEEGHRFRSARARSRADDDEDPAGDLHERVLFDRGTEAELHSEMRLSELWDLCQRGSLTLDDFLELSTLITEVEGIPGSLCGDCAMLERPNARGNWSLGTTELCRAHLRFRLGYARIDGGGAQYPA